MSLSVISPTRYFLYTVGFVLLSIGLAPASRADTIPFGGQSFTLTNTNSDGSATVSSDGSTLTIIGPNNGSGEPGTTDLLTTAFASGLVSFQWAYSSLDTPGADSAAYVLNGSAVQLADTDGQTGTTQFSVNAGDLFGFEMASLDNQGEPGILTVTDFSAPAATSVSPEPGTAMLLFISGAAGLAMYRTKAGLRTAE